MSESGDTQTKPGGGREVADRQALDHVEKWIAVIHELNGERISGMSAGARLERLLAPVTE